jgi:hypothetical protein
VIFLIDQPKYLESLLEVLIKNVAIAILVNSNLAMYAGVAQW